MSPSATNPSQEAQASTLVDELAILKKGLSKSETSTRRAMIAKAQDLVAALETPMEWTLRKMWAEVSDLDMLTRISLNALPL